MNPLDRDWGGEMLADVTAAENFAECAQGEESASAVDPAWTDAVPGLRVGDAAPVVADVVEWGTELDRDDSSSPRWAEVPRAEVFSLASRARYAIAEATLFGFAERPTPGESAPAFVEMLGQDPQRAEFDACNTSFHVAVPAEVEYLVVTVGYDFAPESDLRVGDVVQSSYFLKLV
ncbi:hypothetical protein C1Y63_05430 [Corynebacterium sp. 13CS0277]|uniref:hypothetical protein n=1 Tax=Corynebacterium sp. 13CS0277 TaxID=2071994 RepID=UPI000D0271D4|nr:hypothetical protein [Corynebacterium sp. 13CS0277]PRQ11620.1 hypothetical protein C1Y63_05430 [Corynebacterium sp. 13CS0277]